MTPTDRYLFDRALAIALADSRSPGEALGLSFEALAALYPGRDLGGDGSPPAAPEEPDLRALLLEHRTGANPLEEPMALIIARRALEPNHLWQDLGLANRGDLSLLMRRHFAPLARLNARDMKWKKFLYRELCRREGVFVCKSPVCEACDDFALCFGAEEGQGLAAAE